MELDLKQPEIVDQVNFRESAASRFKGVWFPYFGNDFGNLVSATKPEVSSSLESVCWQTVFTDGLRN